VSTSTPGDRPRYRAVVVGCGRIGSSFAATARGQGVQSHAQAYARHERVELVGVCDSDPDRLAEAAELWSVEGGADAVRLCRRLRPDIVSVCTPDASHAPLAQAILEEAPPRLLFVEKPLALSVEEGRRLLELAEHQGCAVAVNYLRRFSPGFQALARELHEGRHGRPLLARVLYGKGLLHNGSHAIDLLRLWLGEPEAATGQPAVWGPDDDPTYAADLVFANDCRARLDAFDERVATVFEMDFFTERSRWRFWLGGSEWEFSEVRESPTYAGYRNYLPTGRGQTDPRFAQPLADCLRHAVDNLVASLDGERALLCTGADGLAALTWAESIRTGE
jgi:predicted dehydrogenase